MTKPLSQDEIDILLEVRSQLGDQEASEYDFEALSTMIELDAEKRISLYNFKRPRLFSQDQMRLLNYVHDAFARDLSVYLSAQLRTIVDINLTAMDQVLYSEYVMSSAPPSALYVIEVKELAQQFVFELDPRLVIFTIEKLFGGPGTFLRKPRELSQIERRIMSKIMGRVLRELQKAWQQVYGISLQETAFESNAEFVQIIPGVEPALVGTFEVSIYEQQSFINICYPYILLERMLGRTGIKQWLSNTTTQVDPRVRARYESMLRNTIVEMRAELGRTRLPVSELTQLQVGDVIPLEQRVTDAVRVFVGQRDRFRATSGRVGKRRALKILDVIEPQFMEEDDELT
ncbi:flagellar motor switch protein FliM [Rhodocaloribacter litoris]|uniref:flagellar motor switch protein FliM n=1 Tax=Rhodocaloribacter litoris TaxID=2558931 RepID=UPI001423C32E|nr:flagellar motor switch protein FliM [Rhodocaloribacter litoris]QXD16062.1 flagellar motor switch protein FliM [Rhodocaloribacter litoris]